MLLMLLLLAAASSAVLIHFLLIPSSFLYTFSMDPKQSIVAAVDKEITQHGWMTKTNKHKQTRYKKSKKCIPILGKNEKKTKQR
ncbi:MAG: hypothetical protein J3R72DRAFT_452890 [Linnemannia gamsii]|nr:MAG: hypothetical protein J3R72DRAFT_452890 [Linnemannia gamsii]